MRVLVLGSGVHAGAVSQALGREGHEVAAVLAGFASAEVARSLLGTLGARGVVVVADEAAAPIEALEALLKDGSFVAVFASPGSPLLAWAQGLGLPAFAYPPQAADILAAAGWLRAAEAGDSGATEGLRRAASGELAAAPGAVDVGVVAVTGPKGGTGKTMVAAGLAAAAAVCGFETYLVDADQNGGTLHWVFPVPDPDEAFMTLPSALELERARPTGAGRPGGLAGWGQEAGLLRHFRPVDRLPALKVLYGVSPERVAEPVLSDPELADRFVGALVRAAAGRGLLILGAGINPALAVHQAAIRHCQGLVLVVRPELPDLEQAAAWFRQIVAGLLRGGAVEDALAVLARLKVVYNDVDPAVHTDRVVRRLHADLSDLVRSGLEQVLGRDPGVRLQPSAVLPAIPRRYAAILGDGWEHPVLRYRRDPAAHPELAPFVEGLVLLLSGFVRAAPEAARRAGLLPAGLGRPRRRLFGLL